MPQERPPLRADLSRRLYDVLDHGSVDGVGRVVARLIVLPIVINLAAVTLESVPSIQALRAANSE